MSQLNISLLGSCRITLDEQLLSNFKTRKMKALLAYLAVESQSPQRRSKLSDLFWPGQKGGRNNLRQTLFGLRQYIPQLNLHTTRDAIQLVLDQSCTVDVARFKELIASCQQHAHPDLEQCSLCIGRLREAADLYRGDFLEQFYLGDSTLFDEWSILTQELLRRQALWALRHLVNSYLRQEAYDLAHAYAWRQIVIAPLCEEGHQQLMWALYLSGRRSEALTQYEHCRKLLTETLNVTPAAETIQLYEKIRSGAARHKTVSVERQTPMPKCPPPTPSKLIGRTAELDYIEDCLNNPVCRLLTITGPGGVGKTQLAIKAGRRYGPVAEQGAVCYVPLADLPAQDLVETLLSMLQTTIETGQDRTEMLLMQMEEARLLLVLDGYDQLTIDDKSAELGRSPHAVLDFIRCILTKTVHVKIIVTSREILRLQSEWVLDVDGLHYPMETVDKGQLSTIDWADYPALSLFVRSAQQARADFVLSNASLGAVIRICQLTRGNPLALILAGVFVRHYVCEEIVAAIIEDPTFLQVELHDMPSRHRSLHAVFTHSWRRLSADERRVLKTISRLPAQFSTNMVQRQLGNLAKILLRLIDKSWVRRLPAGGYLQYTLLTQFVLSA